jgi:hypothetical protein
MMRFSFATVAVLSSVFFPLAGESRVAPYGAAKAEAPQRSTVIRPNIVENGSDLILFPSAGLSYYDPPESVAFTPDGDAYFGIDYPPNTITRFSPDGTFTSLDVPFAGSDVIYAHGWLWTGSHDGVVAFSPDATRRRDYYLATPIESVVSGPGGSVYAIAHTSNATTKTTGGKLFRVGGSLPERSVVLPVRPLGPFAVGADALPYFSYENDATGAFGIARVENSGATTLFPITGYGSGLQAAYSLVPSNVYLYFTFICSPTISPTPQLFGRISTTGAITELPLPALASGLLVSTLSVDQGGNIWTIVGGSGNVNSALLQYNVYTGHYSGPYATSPGSTVLDPGPFVGPDDNIYFIIRAYSPTPSLTFAAYVTHVQTLEPASLSLAAGTPSPFAVLETHFNGPWTAQSLNPSVASVAPATSTTGQFTVTPTGPGLTSIAVKDRLGNVSYELVSAS